MLKGLTPKRYSHDNLSCVPWINIKVFFQNLVQCISINKSSWDFKSDLKIFQKTNTKIHQHNWRNKQWGSNHWNISIIMLYSSTQSESSVFVVKSSLVFTALNHKKSSNPVQNTSLHQLSNNCTPFTLKVDSEIHRTGIFALYKVYLRGMHDRWTKVFR